MNNKNKLRLKTKRKNKNYSKLSLKKKNYKNPFKIKLIKINKWNNIWKSNMMQKHKNMKSSSSNWKLKLTKQNPNIILNFRKLKIMKKPFQADNLKSKKKEKNKWLNFSKNRRSSRSSSKRSKMRHLMMKKSLRLTNN